MPNNTNNDKPFDPFDPTGNNYKPVGGMPSNNSNAPIPLENTWQPIDDKGFVANRAADVQDTAVSLGKGVVGVPQFAAGLGDMVSGGAVTRNLKKLGVDFNTAQDMIEQGRSDQGRGKQLKFEQADGVWEKTKTALANPSLVRDAVVESLPSMLAGGAIGRGVGMVEAASKFGLKSLAKGGTKEATDLMAKNAVRNAAIGEGAVMAGQQANQIMQEQGKDELSLKQSLAAATTGVLGGLISLGAGRVATKMGVANPESMIAGGTLSSPEMLSKSALEIAKLQPKSVTGAAIRGAISEGLLEELPQSVMEQVIQNLAVGKDWYDGVDSAAVMGTLSGAAMGAVPNVARQFSQNADIKEYRKYYNLDDNGNPIKTEDGKVDAAKKEDKPVQQWLLGDDGSMSYGEAPPVNPDNGPTSGGETFTQDPTTGFNPNVDLATNIKLLTTEAEPKSLSGEPLALENSVKGYLEDLGEVAFVPDANGMVYIVTPDGDVMPAPNMRMPAEVVEPIQFQNNSPLYNALVANDMAADTGANTSSMGAAAEQFMKQQNVKAIRQKNEDALREHAREVRQYQFGPTPNFKKLMSEAPKPTALGEIGPLNESGDLLSSKGTPFRSAFQAKGVAAKTNNGIAYRTENNDFVVRAINNPLFTSKNQVVFGNPANGDVYAVTPDYMFATNHGDMIMVKDANGFYVLDGQSHVSLSSERQSTAKAAEVDAIKTLDSLQDDGKRQLDNLRKTYNDGDALKIIMGDRYNTSEVMLRKSLVDVPESEKDSYIEKARNTYITNPTFFPAEVKEETDKPMNAADAESTEIYRNQFFGNDAPKLKAYLEKAKAATTGFEKPMGKAVVKNGFVETDSNNKPFLTITSANKFIEANDLKAVPFRQPDGKFKIMELDEPDMKNEGKLLTGVAGHRGAMLGGKPYMAFNHNGNDVVLIGDKDYTVAVDLSTRATLSEGLSAGHAKYNEALDKAYAEIDSIRPNMISRQASALKTFGANKDILFGEYLGDFKPMQTIAKHVAERRAKPYLDKMNAKNEVDKANIQTDGKIDTDKMFDALRNDKSNMSATQALSDYIKTTPVQEAYARMKSEIAKLDVNEKNSLTVAMDVFEQDVMHKAKFDAMTPEQKAEIKPVQQQVLDGKIATYNHINEAYKKALETGDYKGMIPSKLFKDGKIDLDLEQSYPAIEHTKMVNLAETIRSQAAKFKLDTNAVLEMPTLEGNGISVYIENVDSDTKALTRTNFIIREKDFEKAKPFQHSSWVYAYFNVDGKMGSLTAKKVDNMHIVAPDGKSRKLEIMPPAQLRNLKAKADGKTAVAPKYKAELAAYNKELASFENPAMSSINADGSINNAMEMSKQEPTKATSDMSSREINKIKAKERAERKRYFNSPALARAFLSEKGLNRFLPYKENLIGDKRTTMKSFDADLNEDGTITVKDPDVNVVPSYALRMANGEDAVIGKVGNVYAAFSPDGTRLPIEMSPSIIRVNKLASEFGVQDVASDGGGNGGKIPNGNATTNAAPEPKGNVNEESKKAETKSEPEAKPKSEEKPKAESHQQSFDFSEDAAPKYSRTDSTKVEGSKGVTSEEARRILSERFGKETIDRLIKSGRLKLVETHENLGNNIEGYFIGGQVVLITGNINPNNIVAVFLHELGGHAGFQGMMSDTKYQRLMEQFNRLVDEKNPIALEALRLAQREGDVFTSQLEMLPYLLSVASMESTTANRNKVRQLLRNLMANVKAFVFDKTGINMNLQPFDMVKLANRMIDSASKGATIRSRTGHNLYSTADTLKAFGSNLHEDFFKTVLRSDKPTGTLHWWHKTLGTQDNLAKVEPLYKRVFDLAQKFIDDVAKYANMASDLAPTLIPRMETAMQALRMKTIKKSDNDALAKPVFEGTLSWGRDKNGKLFKADDIKDAGVVFTESELKSIFKLTDDQVKMYNEFRAATNESLVQLAKSEIVNLMGKDGRDLQEIIMGANSLSEAYAIVKSRMDKLIESEPKREATLKDMLSTIQEVKARAFHLMQTGYAPLSRFGRHSVTVLNNQGEIEYFEMFETRRDARKKALQLGESKEFQGMEIARGTMSQNEFKLLKGIDPTSLELFGDALGLNASGEGIGDQVYQQYLKLARSNRSSMKRMIERKGTMGYSDDVPRVLSSFLYSNSRKTALNLVNKELGESIQAIPKEMGELKDAAVALREHVFEPKEQSHALAAKMFGQFLGGSVASAMVNLTQPHMITMPELAMYTSTVNATKHVNKAFGEMMMFGFDGLRTFDKVLAKLPKDEAEVLRRVDAEGKLSPQEIFYLMDQAQGKNKLRVDDGTLGGKLGATAANSFQRIGFVWGRMFGMAEQMNRRVAFLAAYRVAKEENIPNPVDFALQLTSETQMLYSKAAKSPWARSTLGGLAMTFKTYMINYVQILGRLWMRGEKGSPERANGRKAAMLMLGMLVLVSGVGGLPFAGDVEDMIDTILQRMGYNIQIKSAREEFVRDTVGTVMGNIINEGLLSSLPMADLVNVSGRLGLGDLIPMTGALKPNADFGKEIETLVGPAGDYLKRQVQATDALFKGDWMGATVGAPLAVRNLIKGVQMATDGYYKGQDGRMIAETSYADAFAKAIGFQPNSVARVQTATREALVYRQNYTAESNAIKELWAKGIYEKDEGIIEDARKRLARWNENNPDMPMKIRIPDVLRRARNMNKTKAERVVESTPKALRAGVSKRLADTMSSMGIQPDESDLGSEYNE